MPNFIELRKWVQKEYAAAGLRCSTRQAKAIAGQYLLSVQAVEDGTADSTITYADPTGEEACRRWVRAKLDQVTLAAA